MKIVTVVGARPQFIKASALSREIKNHPEIEEVIVHTGQHFDANMSDIFFQEMEIPSPKYQLDIHSLSHGAMTGRMLEAIEKILIQEKPDYTVVYGDTNSTLAGALAARKLQIKIAHIEAGLRSFNMSMPEEINRILTDRISDVLFCPTDTAVNNLLKEGYDHFDINIVQSGDIMFDAALFYKAKADMESTIIKELNLTVGDYVLATIHRQENTDESKRLLHIIDALNSIHQQRTVIVPIHPRTRKLIERQNIQVQFKLIDPVGYLDMISLTSNAALVMTDSGGLQKEAYFFGKYCITLRDQTEWVELVEGNFNFLAGADREVILQAYFENAGPKSSFDANLYGDGQAAKKIIEALHL
jgi:UDP-GlcNAc3NAcA epimerase